ncbi:hypothetical protein [Pseudolactococcus reticulitermitis]|uniref:Uncharacterized protein n=1 Tax=Pseudolactococcus reticulitermitis TaxID=2025039 RepID=A0A224WWU6_9LACT|nr:hypothetical protein [Lactococcus reticulitermitis]GAX46799.1 hypothetical protein RsY01_379 [Lactococcus reticulitermitis]
MAENSETITKDVIVTAGIIEKGALILREYIGDEKDESGEVYELCISLGQRAPIIRMPSGDTVYFRWESLIEAAKKALEEENAK